MIWLGYRHVDDMLYQDLADYNDNKATTFMSIIPAEPMLQLYTFIFTTYTSLTGFQELGIAPKGSLLR